ncbi:hypothetical protein [Endozoicomonas euniceicola]|uniref:DNA adenine methylase n=1 Tax=Endozoicomonas euniceicola TaxID=1234143 RepID=A0ABY6GQM4_9GAMM|nr:hypothetical protein [Endozoicomonas euniceicola]UYM14867.1 hypothetical protein NX720_18525 [Endozoicomonas euniceicola]
MQFRQDLPHILHKNFFKESSQEVVEPFAGIYTRATLAWLKKNIATEGRGFRSLDP